MLTATILTKEDLRAKGFACDYPHWYKGSKREPRAQIHYHKVENLAGKKVRLIALDDPEKDLWRVEMGGHEYTVHSWLFKESVQHTLLAAPRRLRVKGKDAKFYGTRFSFPCNAEHLDTEDAVRLARWVLKQAKSKKA